MGYIYVKKKRHNDVNEVKYHHTQNSSPHSVTIITLMISVSFDHPFSLNENRRFLGLPQGTKRQRSMNYSPDNLTYFFCIYDFHIFLTVLTYFIMQENTLVMKRTLEIADEYIVTLIHASVTI